MVLVMTTDMALVILDIEGSKLSAAMICCIFFCSKNYILHFIRQMLYNTFVHKMSTKKEEIFYGFQ